MTHFSSLELVEVVHHLVRRLIDWCIKLQISGLSDIGDLQCVSLNLPSVPIPAILSTHCCESSVESTNQAGQSYHMAFRNGRHKCGNGLDEVSE